VGSAPWQEGPRSTISFQGVPPRWRLWAQGLTATLTREANSFTHRAPKTDLRSIVGVGGMDDSVCTHVRAREGASVMWEARGAHRTQVAGNQSGGTPSLRRAVLLGASIDRNIGARGASL
jgi:hypothetical protein